MRKYIVICDRCGKPFEYSNTEWGGILREYKYRRFKFKQLMYGNPSGHDYTEREYQLCGKCTKELKEWLKPLPEPRF